MMTYEEARDFTVRRKKQGATYNEIIEELQVQGAINRRTGKPYKRPIIAKWCQKASGGGPLIGDQRGYRHPHLIGLTAEEREIHDAEMHRRKLERSNQWRAENPDKVRGYAELYKSLY